MYKGCSTSLLNTYMKPNLTMLKGKLWKSAMCIS